MTKNEWEDLKTLLFSDTTNGNGMFRMQLLQVLWEIRDAIKGELEE